MKKIIEVSNEILVLYDVLKNNKHMNKYKKHKILKKIEELSYLENHLFSMLKIDKEHYEGYIQEIDSCKNVLINIRLSHYLHYLYSKNKIFYPNLIYLEYAKEHPKNYKYFELEKEFKKFIIKNSSSASGKFNQLFVDKLLELEFFENNFRIKFNNIEENLSNAELKIFKISKKYLIANELEGIIYEGVKKEKFSLIKSLREFSGEQYNEICEELIKNVKEKDKLELFLSLFSNRNKLK